MCGKINYNNLDNIFPLDEAILEAMSGLEQPWGGLHHKSYFLPKLDDIEHDEFKVIFSDKSGRPVVPLSSLNMYAEGNMANMSPTIPINIYHIPRNIENVYIGEDCSPDEIKDYADIFNEFRDGLDWSYEELLGIELCMVECGIRTYSEVIPIQLVDHEGTALVKPRNGLYLKKYYA